MREVRGSIPLAALFKKKKIGVGVLLASVGYVHGVPEARYERILPGAVGSALGC